MLTSSSRLLEAGGLSVLGLGVAFESPIGCGYIVDQALLREGLNTE